MGYDSKYGEVTTEHGQIGEDEPVVVFRGRDRLLPKVLKVYRIMCELAGSPDHHLELIDDTAGRVKQWQATNQNRVRTPTSDAYMRRIGAM